MTAVLAACDAESVDSIVCLGDLVGYGADPNECVRLAQARGIRAVAGNHDTVATGLKEPVEFSDAARRAIIWTRLHVAEETRRALQLLPLVRIVDARFVIVHGALHPHPNEDVRLKSADEARQSFGILSRDFPGLSICFFGHTHWPAIYEHRGQVTSRPAVGSVGLDRKAQYLINPGSVGQSRDGRPGAAFAIFDSIALSISFRRVGYDSFACQRKAREAGLLPRSNLMSRSADWIRSRIRRGTAALMHSRHGL